MIEISPLRSDEYAAWQPLAQAYMTFYATTRQPAEYERLWGRLQAGPDLHSFGARVDGRLVGFTHYLFHASCWSADICYLQDLFVSPEHRGRGVGGALIGRVAEAARRRGSPRVYWLTQSTNEVARRLYDRVAAHRGFIRYELDIVQARLA